MSHEQASLVKAWTTLRGRECVALAREVLGGNGVVAEFLVAKQVREYGVGFSLSNVLLGGEGLKKEMWGEGGEWWRSSLWKSR